MAAARWWWTRKAMCCSRPAPSRSRSTRAPRSRRCWRCRWWKPGRRTGSACPRPSWRWPARRMAGCRSMSRRPASMLRKAGREPDCLECGMHWPTEPGGRRRPGRVRRSCPRRCTTIVPASMRASCAPPATNTLPVAGYIRPEHPVMRAATTAASANSPARGWTRDNRAVDGCGIPTHAIPLRALALGFARFGSGDRPPAGPRRRVAMRLRRTRWRRIRCWWQPPDRFDTRLMQAVRRRRVQQDRRGRGARAGAAAAGARASRSSARTAPPGRRRSRRRPCWGAILPLSADAGSGAGPVPCRPTPCATGPAPKPASVRPAGSLAA